MGKIFNLESVCWVFSPHKIILCSVKVYIVGECGKSERLGDGGGESCLFV